MPKAQGEIVDAAEIMVVHRRVYTENAKQPGAGAVAIRNGKIVAVGDDAEIERTRGASTKVIDAGGKLVLPGLVDCHIHFLDRSFILGGVNLEVPRNTTNVQKRLPQYASWHPAHTCTLHRRRH